MANVTIRNLDDRLIKKLKARAKANNRSLEAELREILAKDVEQADRLKRFRAAAARISAMTPKVPQTDSSLLVREDRER